MHAHAARGIRCAHGSICARPRHQTTETQNPPKAAGLHIRRTGKLYRGRQSFPEIAGAFKREIRATSKVRPGCRFRAGCAATPEALLLSFVPITLDLYRSVRRHLHWTL